MIVAEYRPSKSINHVRPCWLMPRTSPAGDRRKVRRIAVNISPSCRSFYFTKKQAHQVLHPVGHSLLMTARLLLFRDIALHVNLTTAAPHDAACERCAALHVASREHCAAPHVASCERYAALDAVSYQALLERLVPHRMVQDRMVLERMVLAWLAVPEPQHLT